MTKSRIISYMVVTTLMPLFCFGDVVYSGDLNTVLLGDTLDLNSDGLDDVALAHIQARDKAIPSRSLIPRNKGE